MLCSSAAVWRRGSRRKRGWFAGRNGVARMGRAEESPEKVVQPPVLPRQLFDFAPFGITRVRFSRSALAGEWVSQEASQIETPADPPLSPLACRRVSDLLSRRPSTAYREGGTGRAADRGAMPPRTSRRTCRDASWRQIVRSASRRSPRRDLRRLRETSSTRLADRGDRTSARCAPSAPTFRAEFSWPAAQAGRPSIALLFRPPRPTAST